METVLTSCSDGFALQQSLEESNYSSDILSDNYQFDVRCQLAVLLTNLGRVEDGVAYLTCAIIAPLGLSSSLVSFYIFWHKRHQRVTHGYFQAITILDSIYILFQLPASFGQLFRTRFPSTFFARFSRCLNLTLSNALTDAVELILFLIGIDRLISQRFPLIFAKLDRRFVCVLFVISALILTIATNVPTEFLINDLNSNNRSDNQSASGKAFWIYQNVSRSLAIVRAFLILIGASICLFQVSKTGCKLSVLNKRRGRSWTVAEDPALQNIEQNRELCLLQVCESWPRLLSRCLLFATGNLSVVIDCEAFQGLSSDEASTLAAELTSTARTLMAVRIVVLISHTLHLFSCAFSLTKVQIAAWRMLTTCSFRIRNCYGGRNRDMERSY